MNKHIFAWLVAPALILAGCQPSVQKAETIYCKDLANLKQSLAELAAITPDSKVGDVRKARNNVDRALSDVKRSAAQVKEARTNALEKATDDLDRTIQNLPNRDTLAQAAATVKPKVAAVEAARAQLESQVNCNP